MSVLLLAEDSAKNADETLRLFIVKLLGHIAPGSVTRDDSRWWEPANDEARQGMRANAWKSRRADRARLCNYVATKLRQEHGFVFLHVDGDCAYRDRAKSENRLKFDSLIRRQVEESLRRPPAPRTKRRRSTVTRNEEDIERELAKLVLVMPFYSIEAWLFQNTRAAARHCPGEPRCRQGCASKLAAWGRDRGALDEILQPKKQLCFKDRHNLELAGAGYPLGEVLAAGKSLHDTVSQLQHCTPLRKALEQRLPDWQRPHAP